MRKYLFLISAIFFLTSILHAQDTGNQLAITHATYLDVKKGKLVENVTILIENNLIKEIGKKLEIPEGIEVYDASGKYIMPGMIDSHIHFFQSGGLYTRPDFIDLREVKPYDEERKWMAENYKDFGMRYLRLGITTIIDVGGPMSNFDIRKKAGKEPFFPNVFVTGPLISTYVPEAFADLDDKPIIKVSTEEEARRMVRMQLPYKPDFIKIWYIHKPGLDAGSTYPIIEAAIDESHKNDLLVAVHATQLTTAKLAVKAGADFLVHSVDDTPVDKEFINMLKESDVVISPTLMVIQQYYESISAKNNFSELDLNYANPFALGSLLDVGHLPDYKETFDNLASILEGRMGHDSLMLANLKVLSDAGIPIATGTDAGNIGTQHASSYYEEMQLMKIAGMSNAQILKASTLDAALSIGKNEILGSIEEGKLADLIISSVNPLEEISFANSIEKVIKNGEMKDVSGMILDTPEMLAQRQLNAYNLRDIDAFLEPYAEDVEIYSFPDELMSKGKQAMRQGYAEMFDKTPELYCELENRIVLGNTVIDHELVTGFGGDPIKAIAIYKIENGKIAKVYFIK